MVRNKKIRKHAKGYYYVRWLLIFSAVIFFALFAYGKGRQIWKPAAGISGEAGGGFSFEALPEFDGDWDYCVLMDNRPGFTEQELAEFSGEHYSELDSLGRCGAAMARLHRRLMPTEAREDIGQIKPAGWHQAKYPGIVDSEPPYLYNRCHLIAFGFTGQNANEKNLITGTRYFNSVTMYSFEEKVMKYLEATGNNVLYRVTPHYMDDELVARGVEMEAYSLEDRGAGICFHVFVKNYQPGILLDYRTGESQVKGE